MLVNVHITTCHRSDVKCRVRPRDSHTPYGWNISEWNQEERLNISKSSVYSILAFADSIREYHEVEIHLLDDGSNYPEALDWLNTVEKDPRLSSVKRFPAGGSSSVINAHFESIHPDTDLIFHVEDDNLAFNPLDLEWADACRYRLKRYKEEGIGVLTFRSGLPTDPKDRGYRGSWGPQGTSSLGDPIFNMMGNAHHVMTYETYKQFMPLQGNTGGCESLMCQRLAQLGLRNAEVQEYIYMFHTHKWTGLDKPSEDIELWNKSGEGWEYGMKEMEAYILEKRPLILSRYVDFPDNKTYLYLNEHDYKY